MLLNTRDRELTEALERVITIDGRGRPEKARLLVTLINETPKEKLVEVLTTIGERKFF